MIIKHRGRTPIVHGSAYIAPTAVLSGDVRVGPDSRIMFGAVLNSEGSVVDIGESTIICENAVIRATAEGDKDHPVIIKNYVFISPQATVLGCRIESYAYIATGATVLQGATIREGGVVAVGALVHAGAVIPPEFVVPPQTVAVGDPVRIYGPSDKEALLDAIEDLNFAKAAFNVDAGWEDRRNRSKLSTQVRSKEFKSHFDDVEI